MHFLQHGLFISLTRKLGVEFVFICIVSSFVPEIMTESSYENEANLLHTKKRLEFCIEANKLIKHLSNSDFTCMREKAWAKLWYEITL